MRLLVEERLTVLTDQLNQAPPRKYLDATRALLSWLSEVEELLSESILITDIATMEKNMTHFKVIQTLCILYSSLSSIRQ